MADNFLFAMVLLLLLMAGLFKSLKDSVLVVLSIPLATVGGVIAIRIMNIFTFQPMDLLTMIGFIILLGLVVNNAILLVHQTRIGSPQEIESEIIEPQEEVLQGIPGLESMNAWANQGNAWINLEFGLDTDMQKTLIEVISRMNRVPPLPRDALSPNIMLAGSGGDAPALTYFFLQRLPGNPNEINTYVTFFTDVIKPQLESIPGVARARMESGVGGVEEFATL